MNMKVSCTIKRALLGTAALAAVAGLGACGGGGDDDVAVVTPPPTPPAARFEDQFGANFGISFRAVANSDPRDPAPGDIIPISFTTDPVNIP